MRDHFGWVLQVGVYDHNGIARGFFESRGDGDLVTEVAREEQHANMRVGLLKLREDQLCAVVTTVVNEDQLVIQRRHPAEHRRETLVRRAQHLLLVVAGNDDRQQGRFRF